MTTRERILFGTACVQILSVCALSLLTFSFLEWIVTSPITLLITAFSSAGIGFLFKKAATILCDRFKLHRLAFCLSLSSLSAIFLGFLYTLGLSQYLDCFFAAVVFLLCPIGYLCALPWKRFKAIWRILICAYFVGFISTAVFTGYWVLLCAKSCE